MLNDTLTIKGELTITLIGEDGEVKVHEVVPNLITLVGAQYYAGRAALGAGLPAQVTGIKLGTGTTAPATTGAGAALVSYLANSNQPIDAGFPTVVGNKATWQATFAAGKATSAAAIREAVLVTESIANNDTSTAAETIARALIDNIPAKGASEVMIVQWSHTLGG